MFERASSVVCRRSTSLRRDVDLARARAGREARDEVLQLLDLLLALRVVGLDRRADLRLRHDHVVVAAGVGDDRLVVDVGDVGATRSGSGDRARSRSACRCSGPGNRAASGSSRGRGGWSARRAAAPAVRRRAPARAARGPSGRPAARTSSVRGATRECPGRRAGRPRRSPPCSRLPRRRRLRARRGACRRSSVMSVLS